MVQAQRVAAGDAAAITQCCDAYLSACEHALVAQPGV